MTGQAPLGQTSDPRIKQNKATKERNEAGTGQPFFRIFSALLAMALGAFRGAFLYLLWKGEAEKSVSGSAADTHRSSFPVGSRHRVIIVLETWRRV